MQEVTLRDEDGPGGTRHLSARIAQNGDLQIIGQDLGRSVEGFWGGREYEWSWTVRAEHLPALEAALGGPVLAGLAARFSGPSAIQLDDFLDAHVPISRWSRVGD